MRLLPSRTAIADADMPSKRLFSFIMFMFTLVKTGSKEPPPIDHSGGLEGQI